LILTKPTSEKKRNIIIIITTSAACEGLASSPVTADYASWFSGWARRDFTRATAGNTAGDTAGDTAGATAGDTAAGAAQSAKRRGGKPAEASSVNSVNSAATAATAATFATATTAATATATPRSVPLCHRRIPFALRALGDFFATCGGSGAQLLSQAQFRSAELPFFAGAAPHTAAARRLAAAVGAAAGGAGHSGPQEVRAVPQVHFFFL
jgi:hypothetical protein